MLEWVVFVGLLFFTGWFLKAFVFTPFSAAPIAAPVASPSADPRTYTPESWCLVGENTLGRYCVESTHCKAIDRFPSREACEYTEASALPLGVTREGGLVHNTFMQPREDRYHTF
jgi:hypothetical protein